MNRAAGVLPPAADSQAEQARSGSPRRGTRTGTLLAWHRRLGLAAVTGVVLWCVSGLLHPIMTHLQPAPATFRAALRVPQLDRAMHPARILRAHGVDTITDLRVVAWNDGAFYQVTLPDEVERRYFGIEDGAPLADGDRRFAQYLARQYLGGTQAKVASARLVTAFGYEYSYINRLLPVWRIEFERPDHMRVFVDTRTGRLGTLLDDLQAFSSAEFSILHRWLWLDQISPVARIVVLCALIAAALSVAAIGGWLYVVRWQDTAARWNLRRIHRVMAIAASAVVLILPLSGGYHLLHIGLRGDAAYRHALAPTRIAATELRIGPTEAVARAHLDEVESLSVIQLGAEAFYRIQPANAQSPQSDAEHTDHVPSGKVTPGSVRTGSGAVYVSARDGTIEAEGELRHVRDIAWVALGRPPVGPMKTVAQFGNEYGFVFKRLPVSRVDLGNGIAVFVDPADGAIAAVIDDADRTEGWVFAYVHKFEWLVPLAGSTARDAIAAALALLLACAASAGVVVYVQRWRLRQRE
jgi:hypothetical protein